MDRSDTINLYSDTITYDEYGVAQKVRVAKEVFCKVDSVTRTEFFEAGRNGLKPEFRITMFVGDYDGESIVGYKGRTYSVYRTFLAKTDIIELYVERQTGSDTAEPTPEPTPEPGDNNGEENSG